jgi:hypothetical protein
MRLRILFVCLLAGAMLADQPSPGRKYSTIERMEDGRSAEFSRGAAGGRSLFRTGLHPGQKPHFGDRGRLAGDRPDRPCDSAVHKLASLESLGQVPNGATRDGTEFHAVHGM